MTAGRAGPAAARYVQAVLAVASAGALTWAGVATLARSAADVAVTVLGALLIAAAAGCVLALVPMVIGRPGAAGWGVGATAVTAALATDVVFLDVTRTPHAQLGLDVVMGGVAVAEAALAVWFGLVLFRHGRGRAGAGAALGVVAVLVGFVAWTGYVAAPQRGRPAVTVTAVFTGSRPVTGPAGDLDHVTVDATITVRNDGTDPVVVAASLLRVVGRTSAPAATPIDATVAAGFESDIADALDSARALEPLGPNRHALTGFWPTSDQSQALLELDEVAPAGYRLAAGASYVRRLVADVPALVENPLTSVQLDADVVAVSAANRPDGITLRRCPGQRITGAAGALALQPNRGPGRGYVGCVSARIGGPAPYAGLIDDDPELQLRFLLGNTAVPGSEVGRVDVALHATGGPGAIPLTDPAAAARTAERFLPVATSEASAQAEVSARADATS
jgi:hypothetical protein